MASKSAGLIWNLAVSRQYFATALALALLFAGNGRAQEAYLQLQLDQPMTPEMRLALARVLDPTTDHEALLSAFAQAVPASTLSDLGTLPSHQLMQSGMLARPSQIAIDQTITVTAINLSSSTPGIEKFLFFASPEPGAFDNPAFIVIESESDVFRAYAGLIQFPALAGFDGHDGLGIAAPISQRKILDLDISGFANSVSDTTPIVINSVAVESLARIDRDIEALGYTSRAFPLPSLEDLRAEDLAALNDAWTNAGQPLPLVAEDPSDVEVITYEAAITQTTASGQCSDGGTDWPFSSNQVDAVISRNFQVMEQMGVHHFERTEVMVVDAGLPESLASSETFSRFLYTNLAARLSAGIHTRSTSLTPECTYRDRRPHRHMHGYVVSAGQSENSCLNASDLGEIAPPRPAEGTTNYVWDHGGFVGVLVAGGPDLITATEGLDQLVSVSFARVMREKNGVLRADGTDVLDAIDFAAERNVPILNISLRVKESVRDRIFEALQPFWRGDGLVIAAAGNSGGTISADSTAFPASAVVAPQDNLIVVGGVERESNGRIRLWDQSSRSLAIVDIAAPATGIRSIDGHGNRGCYSGTSVAAPQVSFVAALLRSMGLTRPAEIKRRILATSDIFENLESEVRHGRVLNTVHALDIFTDLLWRDGADAPERVQVVGHPQARGFDFVHLCQSGAESQGWIDLNRLHAFEAQDGGQARIWRDANVPSGITDLDSVCEISDTATILFRTATGEEEISVDQIDRLVPSRFRPALEMAGFQ